MSDDWEENYDMALVIEQAIQLVEGALLGTEGRRGIWTDRDYLVHALAILTDSDRARKAALAKPQALLDANKPLKHKKEPWWWQYEETIRQLKEYEDWRNSPLTEMSRPYLINLYLVCDDIRTLVSGLRDLERKLGEVEGPDPAEKDA